MATTTAPITGYTFFEDAKWENSVITYAFADSSHNPTGSSAGVIAAAGEAPILLGGGAAPVYSTNGSGFFNNYITGSTYISAIQQAFATWSAATGLKFQQVPITSSTPPDIILGWGNLPSTVGGVTYGAINGQVQIAIEDQAINSFSTQGFEAITLHEIGHALGFGHNNNASSIMNPTVLPGPTLGAIDLAGARALYGQSAITSQENAGLVSASTIGTTLPSETIHINSTIRSGQGLVSGTLSSALGACRT